MIFYILRKNTNEVVEKCATFEKAIDKIDSLVRTDKESGTYVRGRYCIRGAEE